MSASPVQTFSGNAYISIVETIPASATIGLVSFFSWKFFINKKKKKRQSGNDNKAQLVDQICELNDTLTEATWYFYTKTSLVNSSLYQYIISVDNLDYTEFLLWKNVYENHDFSLYGKKQLSEQPISLLGDFIIICNKYFSACEKLFQHVSEDTDKETLALARQIKLIKDSTSNIVTDDCLLEDFTATAKTPSSKEMKMSHLEKMAKPYP